MARFARREGLAPATLRDAIERAEKGLVDADLGGGLIKQRVARAGKGRSGGYRTIIAYRRKDRAIFVFGFAKSDRENLEPADLQSARDIGSAWLSANAARIARGLRERELEVILDESEEVDPHGKGDA
ncbi:MAG: type II toxin-antitoxin system RelE/ParE family toxin [Acidobacteriota bacterium]